ncbi:MAG: uroporphyrinogen-III synthase [Rhodocyclaceae bacterium]|jgi:uroporphyrinogen-III synthase|nr:uroporphyrinogen-III synthase [Rhodocyclaceae bacterium]
MTEQAGGPLTGRHIVVTRPAGQAAHLAEALVARGAVPVLFPVLAICDMDDIAPLLDIALRLDSFDLAVFVSPNAVDKALAVILSRRAWPAGLRAATVGLSSEQALARHGIGEVIAPRQRFDSEALLALPALQQMAGKRVIVFRGDGGRELLGDTLVARGARVEYVACYRRARPELDPAPLHALWTRHSLDAFTLTSSEGLRNLHAMVGKLGQARLRQTPVFVPHARIAEQAHDLGIAQVIATGPGDSGLLAGLETYFEQPRGAAGG